MYHCLPRIRFGILGPLLLCVGLAALGTGAVDCFVRWEDARRRNSMGGQQLSKEDLFHHYTGIAINSSPPTGATALSIGGPLFSQFGDMSVTPPNTKAKSFSVRSPAPDFELLDSMDHHQVHLADFRGKKPVVLLFGSFGCDIFCGQLARLNKLHQAYKDRAEFLFVYIRHAPHPGLLPPPTPADKNLGYVPRGLLHFKISFACLLGNQEVEAAYSPYPERLVIVDRKGRIALDAGLGLPKGWDLDWIESMLKKI